MVHKRIPATEVDVKILGEPLKFQSGKQASNRFLKASMTERLSSFDPDSDEKTGIPGQEIFNIYDKWAYGGFGMILTGNVAVHPKNLEYAGNAIIHKEGYTEEKKAAFKKYAQLTKQDGSLAVVQLTHAGRQTPLGVNAHPFSPSDVQLTIGDPHGKPIPLTLEQVQTEVVDRFAFAAKACYEAGFDGVQLHAAHGYLLSQFISNTTNKRKDQYGGSIENRYRVIGETYRKIRELIPASTGFIVGIKVNSVEFQAEGMTVEEGQAVAALIEAEGFDFVELSGGNMESWAFHHKRESTVKREAFFLEFARKIRPEFKKTVVYLTGGFRTAKGMIDAIQEGATQGIGLGRPATAEPDLAKKILGGHVFSAPDTAIDPNNFGVSIIASNSQMEQLGRTSVKEANGDLLKYVSDLSDKEVADRYIKATENYLTEVGKVIESGKPVVGVLVFD